ncbi:CHAT domain-containing protein, partial [Mycena vulgaris]
LLERYHQAGDLKDLEAALQKYQDTVKVSPEGNSAVAGLIENIGLCLRHRYLRLGDLNDLDAALQKYQKAVELSPEGDLNLAGLIGNIGLCFRYRYLRHGHLKDLEAAFQKFQEAVELSPEENHVVKGLSQEAGTLVCYRDRYLHLGDLKDLQAAFQNIQEAVRLSSKGNPILARLRGDIGLCFRDRYLRLGDLKDLEAALQNFQDTLYLIPHRHPDRARCLQNLGICFLDRFRRAGHLKDLEAALQTSRDAVDLTPEGHPDLARLLQNLGNCFMARYHRLGDLKDLGIAQQQYLQATTLALDGHSSAEILQDFAMSFVDRYHRLGGVNNIDEAYHNYMLSFDTSSSRPESSWKAALDWASFAEECGASSQCSYAYSTAFSFLPRMIWICHSIPLRHAALSRLGIKKATSNAIRVCTNGSDVHSAVEIMEQGMATVFQQTLELKADVDELPCDQANDFRRLSFKLYGEASTDTTEILKIVNQRNELLAKIRQQPGQAEFLFPRSYETLRQVSKGGPIVILNSNIDGCDGILIPDPASEPVHIPLPELLSRCSLRVRAESMSTRLFGQRENFTSKTTEECFTELLSWLWMNVVSPVYCILETYGIRKGRLWWLQIGAFTGLPVHACAPDDHFIHSYTATLGSLLDAYARKSSSAAHKVGVVGVTHTGSGGRNYLKGVKLEVEKILSIIEKPLVVCLNGEKATVGAVKKQLQVCSWVHLACHAKQDSFHPTKSHLRLYGGILELETILQMSLSNAEFVFLAGCQTAMGDSELVNESFHLGGGFIAAGFRGVIGTLWSMNDQDGPLVAEVVYSHLFRDGRKPQASDAAEGLHLAVKELKKRKVPYERWIPFIHMG